MVRGLGGLALLAALLVMVDLGELRQALTRARLLPLALGLAALVAMVLLDALRLGIAFRSYGWSFSETLKIHLKGLFLSNFTPGTAGAELYRVGVAHRQKPGLTEPIVLVTLLRVVGTLVQLGLAGAVLLLSRDLRESLRAPFREAGDALPGPAVLVAGIALIVLVAAVVWLLRRHPRVARLLDLLRKVRHTLASFGLGALGELVLVSVGVALSGAAWLYALVRAFGSQVAPEAMLLVLAVATVGSLLPITPGGLGVREGAVVVVLTALGLPTADAVAVAIVQRGYMWAVSLAGGLTFSTSARIGDR